MVESQTGFHEAVDGRSADVGPAEGGKIGVTEIVDQDAYDVWLFGRPR